MDASPILPVKANQQFAPPVGASGLSAVFQALLQESELRLEARSALPTRGPTQDTPNAEPVARHAPDRGVEDARHQPARETGTERDDPTTPRADGPDRHRPDEAEPVSDTPDDAYATPAPEHTPRRADPVDPRGGTGPVEPKTAHAPVADDGAAGLAAPATARPAATAPLFVAEPTPRQVSAPAPTANPAPAQVPTAQTAAANTTVPSLPSGGPVKAEVTPAPVIAHPNAKLGGAAAHAALAQASELANPTLPNGATAPVSDQPATGKPGPVHAVAAGVPAATVQRPSTPVDHLTTPSRVVPITMAQSHAPGGTAAATTAATAAPAATPHAAAVAQTGAKVSVPAEAAIAEPATAATKPTPEGARVAQASTTSTATVDHGVAAARPSEPRARTTGPAGNAAGDQIQIATPRLAANVQTQADGPAARPEVTPATGPSGSTPVQTVTQIHDGQIQAAQGRPAAPDATATVAQAATPEALTSAARTYAKAGAGAAPVQRAELVSQPGTNAAGSPLPGVSPAVARSSEPLPVQPRLATTRPVPIDQVAVHIRKAAVAGQDHIRIRLHPAELGQIDVKLQLNGDGAIRAAIAVDRAETLDLLQRDARGLERTLQDAGLKTDSGSLNFHLRGEGQGGTKGGQNGSADAGPAGRDAADGDGNAATEDSQPAPPSGAERALDITV